MFSFKQNFIIEKTFLGAGDGTTHTHKWRPGHGRSCGLHAGKLLAGMSWVRIVRSGGARTGGAWSDGLGPRGSMAVHGEMASHRAAAVAPDGAD